MAFPAQEYISPVLAVQMNGPYGRKLLFSEGPDPVGALLPLAIVLVWR